MVLPLYPCSQAVLVVVVDTVLNSMQEYLLQFTNLRPKYIQAWIDQLRAELLAAEALPDHAAAQAISSLVYLDLVEKGTIGCELWQELKLSIKGAYSASAAKIHLNSAGQAKYEAAAGGNWADCKAMLTSAKNFLTANLEALTADGNMATRFADEFNAGRVSFNETLSAYESSKEAIPVATDKRVIAFNAIYKKMIAMMLDGQKIFKDNEAVRTQFVFSHVEERVSGPGLAGARGTVANEVGSLPIEGALATLTLASNEAVTHTATTAADGKYLINCPSGDYKLKFTAPGFVDSEVKNITIEVGTVSAFNVKLVPLEGEG